MIVYVTHTGMRDITGRMEEFLSRHGFTVAVMKADAVPPERREAWVAKRVEEGVDVLVCHPRLVQTGLDLVEFPTICWYETASFKIKVKEGAVAPDAPEGVLAAATQTSITLSWQAPGKNGGAGVTGYTVEWSSDGVDWTELEANTPEISYEHASLKVGTVYHCRVAALNSAGAGAWAELTQSTDAEAVAGTVVNWSATLTVGVHGAGGETTHGYSIFLGGMGTLSEDEFNAGDQSIEVVAMLLSNGFLAFNLKPDPRGLEGSVVWPLESGWPPLAWGAVESRQFI